MAKRNGMVPMWKKGDIKKLFSKVGDRLDIIVLDILQRTGEEFVKVARQSGQYIDHTGNLRSSIGYIVLQNGQVANKEFEISDKAGTDKQTGKHEGERLATELVSLFPKGFVLICVAGMKYAAHVEAMENKDVVSLAASEAEDFIIARSRELFRGLK